MLPIDRCPCSRFVLYRAFDCLVVTSSQHAEFTTMTALQEAERLLPNLTRAEKALFAQRLVSDLGDAFPGIENRPGDCGKSEAA